MLKRVQINVETAWFQRLKLTCDKLHSIIAFNFNLRRYSKAEIFAAVLHEVRDETGVPLDALSRPRLIGAMLDADGRGLNSFPLHLNPTVCSDTLPGRLPSFRSQLFGKWGRSVRVYLYTFDASTSSYLASHSLWTG